MLLLHWEWISRIQMIRKRKIQCGGKDLVLKSDRPVLTSEILQLSYLKSLLCFNQLFLSNYYMPGIRVRTVSHSRHRPELQASGWGEYWKSAGYRSLQTLMRALGSYPPGRGGCKVEQSPWGIAKHCLINLNMSYTINSIRR